MTSGINVINLTSGKILNTIGLGDLAGKGWTPFFSFWAMVFMTFFLFGDQNLASSNLSRIGAEYGFVKKEDYLWYIGGLVSLCFFIIGGLFSVISGILTDRYDRKKLLIYTIILGEIPCLLTAFAPDYGWFLLLRTLTGMGIGGIFPLIFSLLGDYFKPINRPTASGWLALSMGLGIASGQLLGGVLAYKEIFSLSGWRASFIIMSIPAFPLVLIYYLFGSVPERKNINNDEKINFLDLKYIFSNKTNVIAFLQGIAGTVPWGFLFVYLVDYYEKTKGFKVMDANVMIIAFGCAAIFGGFAGGFIGRSIYRINRKFLPLFCSMSILSSTIPIFIIVNYKGNDIMPMVLTAIVAGLIAPMTTPNIRAIIINVNPPERRGSVFALFNLADDIGKGLGPFFIGLMLMALPQHIVYNLTVCFWILCSLIWMAMIKTVVPDEDRVIKTI